MSQRLSRIVCQSTLTLVAFAALATVLSAQTSQNIRSVIRYRVKPDRVGEFQAALKEYVALQKKNESERYATWWVSLSGPREYAVVRYYSKWSELDGGPDPKLKEVQGTAQQLMSRVSQCIDNSDRVIDELIPDLTLPRTSDLPKMVRTVKTMVKPDKVDEFRALIAAELFPAVKKAGVKAYGTAQVRYGQPRSVFNSYLGLDGWADLDGPSPIMQAMGQENYQKFLAKYAALVESQDWNVYRNLTELNYLPPQQ